MLFILFIPWILYWIFAALGHEYSVVLSLFASLIILIPQLLQKKYGVMNSFSCIFFGIAALFVYGFHNDIFIKKSLLMGNVALLVMAVISLLIMQPFSFEVSKREYPKAFWKVNTFMAINNGVTLGWVFIFFANSLLFALKNSGWTTVAASVLLIAAGIAYSKLFPVKYSTYLALKEFKQYDWIPEYDLQKKKRDNEYDAIIIGSGLGGLTCGCLLAKKGFKVLFLEMNHQVGGYFTSFKRKGFTFNSVDASVSGIWEKGPVSYFLDEIGIKSNDYFIQNRYQTMFNEKMIAVPNDVKDYVALLTEMYPEEKKGINAFFHDMETSYAECYEETKYYGVPLPDFLIAKVLGEKIYSSFPKNHTHFYDWLINKTYEQKIDEYIKNEELKKLLQVIMSYTGTEKEETPACNALWIMGGYYLHPGFFPKGGAQNLANALKGYIENNNGLCLLNNKVDSIVVENGAAVGVKVNGNAYKSSVIVSNVNARTTFLDLVGENNFNPEYIDYIKSLKMSPSSFIVYLGVDLDLSDYKATIINDVDDYGGGIVLNSNADPSLAPKGQSSLMLIGLAEYEDFPDRGTREYEEKKKEYAERIIRKAEKAIPNLSKHIIVQDAATPKTSERYINMPEGAKFSFKPSMGVKLPYFKSPIKGLYLAGASTFPGGGIEAVVISGIIAFHDITGWKNRREIDKP